MNSIISKHYIIIICFLFYTTYENIINNVGKIYIIYLIKCLDSFFKVHYLDILLERCKCQFHFSSLYSEVNLLVS